MRARSRRPAALLLRTAALLVAAVPAAAQQRAPAAARPLPPAAPAAPTTDTLSVDRLPGDTVPGDPARPVALDRPVARASAAAAAAASAARAAQRSFERSRRQGLRFYNGGAAAACDERMGRICYWNNNGDVPPPAERREIGVERDQLVTLLDSAARIDPTNDWVAGQRVRYLIESTRRDDAIAAARACRGTAWWCAALRGFALHERNDHLAAASAFDSALAAMPPAQRCSWSDPRIWLDGREADAFGRHACGSAARAAAERWLWLLAQPLWMLPANDLRNELLARRVAVRLHAQGAIPYSLSWGDDLAESELRYGWPTAWSVQTAGALDVREPSIIGHEPTPSYDFVPRAAAILDPLGAAGDAWMLGAERARMRYAPRYAPRGFVALSHQIARFRRGDSTLVAGAWNVERDRDWGSGTVRAGLAIVGADGRLTVAARDGAPRRGAIALAMRDTAHLLGLEALGEAQQRAARTRYAVQPLPTDARVSDLLLLAHGIGPAPSLQDALDAALGATVIRAGGTVGLYWESYLAAASDAPVTVSVTATRLNSSWLQRTRSALRVGSRVRPVAVRFTDVGRPDAAPGRALTLTWPAVPPGIYRLELTLDRAGTTATTGVTVRVEER